MPFGDVNSGQGAYDAIAAVNIIRDAAGLSGISIGQKESGVDSTSCYYDEGVEDRCLPRTLMGGTKAMRAAGQKYMPKHEAEDNKTYQSRLCSTICYGGFRDTVIEQSAKFFAEPIDITEVAEPLKPLCDNIDGQGRALTPFAMDLVKEGFTDGLSFLFVDTPKITQGMTRADVLAQGIRCYWSIITANELIGWRIETINGAPTVTQVRIRQQVVVPNGEFGDKIEDQIRVIERNYWRLYEWRDSENEDERGWYLVDAGVNSWNFVALIPFYTNRKAFFQGEPPLQSLAEKNQEHWVSSSEQRRALTFARFAIMFLSGIDPGSSVTVAPDTVIKSMDPQAKGSYLEVSGAGMSAGRQDLEDIKAEMRNCGMTLRLDDAGATTATASAIDSDNSNAVLKAISKQLKDVVELALSYTRKISGGGDDGGKVRVFDDFSNKQAPGTIAELNSTTSAGNLSRETLWDEMKRRNQLSEDFDAEVEKSRLEDQVSRDMNALGGMQPAIAPVAANANQSSKNPEQPEKVEK